MPRLRELVRLEQSLRQASEGTTAGKSLAKEIESLRDLLPTSILAHHDSFTARGKLSIAPVIRGICGACHLALPRGRVAELLGVPDDLRVCDHCGVFIYLGEEQPPPADAALAKALAGKKKAMPSKRARRRPVAGAPKSLRSR
jgi:predicted  nucleic acid-binding Zn-ribbon protein